jgi:putative alpha-1,2-mannosidase
MHISTFSSAKARALSGYISCGDLSVMPALVCCRNLGSLKSLTRAPIGSGKLLHVVFLLLVVLRPQAGEGAESADGTVSAEYFQVRDLVSYVDPMMGAGTAEGKISIGPSMPFGSIMIQPQTAPRSTKTGYNRDEKLSGFTNVNCESVYKYVNLLVSPQVGLDSHDPGNGLSTGHDSEKANETIQAGYYSIDLLRYGIRAEVTTGKHSALYRLTYPTTDQASILIDPSHNLKLQNGNGFGDPLVSSVHFDTDTGAVTGCLDVRGGWYLSDNIRVYFAATLSRQVTEYGVSQCDGTLRPRLISASGKGIGYYLKFSASSSEPVFLKLATSFSSIDQAQRYLAHEIPVWDFDDLKSANQAAWNRALSSILINDDSFTPASTACCRIPRTRRGTVPGPTRARITTTLFAYGTSFGASIPSWN